MISCYHLSIPHPGRSEPLFEDISFEIEAGQWVEFVGPAASGKSVLFSLLALRRAPSEGKLIVAGRNLERLKRTGVAELRQRVGACSQRVRLLEERTVLENLLLPFVARGRHEGALDDATEVLERCGLDELSDRSVHTLSASERRMVGIVRATLGRSELILIDGGFEGLDEAEHQTTRELLEERHGQGTTVVLLQRKATSIDHPRAVEFRIDQGRLERDGDDDTPQMASGAA